MIRMHKHKCKSKRWWKCTTQSQKQTLIRCINTNVKAEGNDVEINLGWQET